MAQLFKPRYHDEECYGAADLNGGAKLVAGDHIASTRSSDSTALIRSAREHIAEKDIKAGVDDIIAAYQHLAEEKAKLATLRNEVYRYLSTARGWQNAPHPQSLRLKRATPSIPLNSLK